MRKFGQKDVRNVAIVAHQGVGKTSLADACLFAAKATTRLGSVDQDTSVFDYEPEEKRRHLTISSAYGHFEWKKRHFTILDTPGEMDFFPDTRNCLMVADAAVIVVSAPHGVEGMTEQLAGYAEDLKVPRVVFVTKMDRERANFETCLADIHRCLGAVEGQEVPRTIALQIPLGQAETFEGVVDLLSLKAYKFATDGTGATSPIEIPANLRDAILSSRASLVERIAEADDTLIEKYLNGADLSEEELHRGLQRAIASGTMIPVLYGAGAKNYGVAQLLDLIANAFPSPGDRAAVLGRGPADEAIERARSESEPLSALVFKTLDSAVGKLSVLRVFSGTLKSDSTLYNSAKKTREHVGHLNVMLGSKLEPIDEAGAGDIIAIAKLKETLTGDTITDEKAPIVYYMIEAPPPRISYAIHAKSKGDEDKVGTALHRLCEEDYTLRVRRDEQTKETLLMGLGQVHVETHAEKLRRKFKIDIDLTVPKVPYKETVRGRAEGEGKHKKQSGGRGQFGVCYLRIEPLPRGGGFEFVDAIVGGSIPRQFIPSVEKGVVKRMDRGVVAGYPVADVRVTCYDGKYHDVDSSDIAFQIAGGKGFQAVFKQAKPCLLEPIVAMVITVPEQYMGDIIGDLSSRRGRVAGYETVGKTSVIKASVPLSKVMRYAAELRSMTSGHGAFTMSVSHNEEVPPDESTKIIAGFKGEDEEGEE